MRSRFCFYQHEIELSDHEVYNHSSFQIIARIQFVVIVLKIIFQWFQYFMFFFFDALSDHTVKSRVKENLLSVQYPSFFFAFPIFFKYDFAASRLFSVKAF